MTENTRTRRSAQQIAQDALDKAEAKRDRLAKRVAADEAAAARIEANKAELAFAESEVELLKGHPALASDEATDDAQVPGQAPFTFGG